jgi:hypothetical protein
MFVRRTLLRSFATNRTMAAAPLKVPDLVSLDFFRTNQAALKVPQHTPICIYFLSVMFFHWTNKSYIFVSTNMVSFPVT